MPPRKTAAPKQVVVKAEAHKWNFKPKFRKAAFGWKSQPAITRIKEAVKEIKAVSRVDGVLAGEGAVIFIERISAALTNIDGSSGAIGSAVNGAIEELASIVSAAACDKSTREAWLERLWKAHELDEIPYIEALTQHWGELCADKELASFWADKTIDSVKLSWRPDRRPGDFFSGTDACLSSLYKAERFDELFDLLKHEPHGWTCYHLWGAKALAVTKDARAAVEYLESFRDKSQYLENIDSVCEEILLEQGETDLAYAKYAIGANQRNTKLATFRAIQKKYPSIAGPDILADLVATTPGAEGGWFATAKELGLYDLAIEFASKSPTDPKTLTRAACDFERSNSLFALNAGLAALQWLMLDYGYDVTSGDVRAAYLATMKAAEQANKQQEALSVIRQKLLQLKKDNFVVKVLGRQVEVDYGKLEPSK